MLNVVVSVSIVIVWVLMWLVAIMHGRYMERPFEPGAEG